MRYVVTILILMLPLIGLTEDAQTFFIYSNNEVHEAPADVATVQLCTLADTTTVVAYAGAIWGEYDLSDRLYCIACSTGSGMDFDEFLEVNGYRFLSEGE